MAPEPSFIITAGNAFFPAIFFRFHGTTVNPLLEKINPQPALTGQTVLTIPNEFVKRLFYDFVVKQAGTKKNFSHRGHGGLRVNKTFGWEN